MSNARYERHVGEVSINRIAGLISTAFGAPIAGAVEWITTQNLADFRAVRSADGRVDACLRRIDMGQYIGGKAVAMAGIAGVAVAPEARGGGLARLMMTEHIRELHADGVPISALYPSTRTLYRQAGYESAGHRWIASLPTAHIDVQTRAGEWTPVGPGRQSLIEPVYDAFASCFTGMLRRGPYIWDRIWQWRDRVSAGYAARNADGAIDAYVCLTQKRLDSGRMAMELTDLAFASEEGGRRLLAFLHDFASMVDDISLAVGPAHPLLMLMGQQRFTITYRDDWMLRIVDVPGALAARGYAPISAQLHLQVTDPLVAANNGPWLLTLDRGVPSVARGGDASLKMDIRGLAPLYTGFLPARALRLAGLLDGPDHALLAADAVFAAGAPGGPWMTDFF